MRPISIRTRQIGSGGCFVIAEAGVNHNGDIALAHRLVEAAARAGADAVKFQTFDPDLLAAENAPKAAYQVERTGAATSQRDMLRQLMLPDSAFRELADHAAELDIVFLSSPFDERSVDLLQSIGLEAYKVGSGELTNHRFLRHVASTGRPILLSTGMATLLEVEEAVAAVYSTGNQQIALFHCVSAYPAQPAWCNLRAMETLKAAFSVPVGWSDHTTDEVVTLAAVALGADVIEKHLTLDRNMEGPDHAASAMPAEFGSLVNNIRTVLSAMGDGVKAPVLEELEVALVARRSLHASRDMPADHCITSDDLVALRPGTGVPPSRENYLVGRTTLHAVQAGQMLTTDMIR